MIGMGRSDKPTDIDTHTVDAHAGWWKTMIDALELQDITLFAQDWGGVHGLDGGGPASAVLSAGNGLQLWPLANARSNPDCATRHQSQDYLVDADAAIRTFDDFAADCNAKGYIKQDMSDFFRLLDALRADWPGTRGQR